MNFETFYNSVQHKVFISYHHLNDQEYKEKLQEMNRVNRLFIDMSVDTNEIDDELSDESIRMKIRDVFLRDSTVTILLVGIETKKRKHIDWEVYSSMINGTKNKKSGILVVNLPSTCNKYYTAPHDGEKEFVYPENTTNWISIKERSTYEERYPYLPLRIIDNLVSAKVKISVVSWEKIENSPEVLRYLLNVAHKARTINEYDLSRPMRRANS